MFALELEQQFRSLDLTFAPRPPVGADFRSAFEDLLGQLFAHQYPAHPEFDTEIKASVVKKVWAEVQKAVAASGHRGLVADTSTRRPGAPCRELLPPGRDGRDASADRTPLEGTFSQCHARDGGGAITVARFAGSTFRSRWACPSSCRT